MESEEITFRLMRRDDFDSVVGIDEEVLGSSRSEYYEAKFEKLFNSNDFVPTSLVAENAEGIVVGFVMGEVYIGEYGINEEGATLDTIGVSPVARKQGIGERLIKEFVDHIRSLGIHRINTLVGKGDSQLMRFFRANEFAPSKTINLERTI